jgi:hypothetical protein
MFLLNKTEEEKIVQNLEKDWISFHYQTKQIEQLNIKRINSITKVTGAFNLALVIILLTGLIPLQFLFAISIIWLTILIRKSLNFNLEINKKISSLKSHMKSKEIHEVTENKFLREYYWLDNIKSDKWEKMLKDNAIGKYKNKK